jgi:NAD(P)H dehydrogenase (quinone)
MTTSFLTTLQHLGMVIVGLPYTEQRLTNMDEITGGGPYGATTLASGDGRSRPVSDNELAIARFQGRYVTELVDNNEGVNVKSSFYGART